METSVANAMLSPFANDLGLLETGFTLRDNRGSLSLEEKVHPYEPRRLEGLGHTLLKVGLTREEKESAAARATNLSASCASVERRLVPLIDPGVAHVSRQVLLRLP